MGFLDREATVAGPGYSRWGFPPAAIAVQMCIGEVYGFSVFNLPLGRLIGGSAPNTAAGDWSQNQIIQIYSIALVVLGLSAALFGKWVERAGPRKTMVASALCFCGGLWISALGVNFHNIWLIYLGYGLIGGIGLGMGYIAPVSTLIKWFPDRPGMATGFAIMGFGSGALIGSPLGQLLMDNLKTGGAWRTWLIDHGVFADSLKTGNSVGVGEAFLVMGCLYIVSMLFGAWIARVPAPGWKPEGWVPNNEKVNPMITQHHVSADEAIKTPQFWFLWVVLCMNVSAGIGILGQFSPMIQAMFGVTAAVGAGFGGLLSIFNMVGRFFWSSTSDYTGRKGIYIVYFVLGMLLYCTIPWTRANGAIIAFVFVCCVIISMYGGGFATIPAYLRDMFGTYQVGAIHGRLITAWSAAAVIGPNLLTGYSQSKAQGITDPALRQQALAQGYSEVMYICAGLLLIGLIANLLVRPVDSKHYYSGADLPGGAPASPSGAPPAGARV